MSRFYPVDLVVLPPVLEPRAVLDALLATFAAPARRSGAATPLAARAGEPRPALHVSAFGLALRVVSEAEREAFATGLARALEGREYAGDIWIRDAVSLALERLAPPRSPEGELLHLIARSLPADTWWALTGRIRALGTPDVERTRTARAHQAALEARLGPVIPG